MGLLLILLGFGILFTFNEIINFVINKNSESNKEKYEDFKNLNSESIASLYALSAKLDKGDVINITTEEKENKNKKKSDLNSKINKESLSDIEKKSSPEPSWLNEYQEMVKNDSNINGIVDADKDGIDDGVELMQNLMK